MLLIYLFLAVGIVIVYGTAIILKKEKFRKYLKFYGFVVGFIITYSGLLPIYYQVFDGDFSYWYYLTPFNVLVVSMTASIGYSGYATDTKKFLHIKKITINPFVLFFLIVVVYGWSVKFAKEWFDLNLRFLLFPWHL